jgi:hypothetical protein
MKNILPGVITVLTILSVGCGGGPTSPAPLASNSVAPVSTPAPPPAPAPAPEPAPPAPTPGPTPAPTPAPDPGTRFTAHVETMHWYKEPLFGQTFELTRYSNRIVFGSVSLPIVAQDDRAFTARNAEMTFSVVGSSWTFNGLAGTGSGSLSR